MTKYNDGGNDGNRSTCKDSHFAWGKIEISTPELIPGRCATVVVTIEDNEMIEQSHVIDILKTLVGH